MTSRILLVLFLFCAVHPAQATIVFQDNFNYTASRADTNVEVEFQAAGWVNAKAENSTLNSGSGYLYTQNDATLGSNVLVM